MDTAAIQDRIRREFTRCYKGATPFYESGPLWDFCMDIVSDKSLIKCMVTANDLGGSAGEDPFVFLRKTVFSSERFFLYR